MTAADLADALRSFDVTATATDVINRTGEDYLNLNRNQMMEGKGKTKNIGRYRRRDYAEFKYGLSGVAGLGNVDLRLTGSFQDKMTFRMSGAEIDVTSSDSKAEGLIDKYGGQIFGLNDKNQTEYNQDVFLPGFLSEVKRQTGLSDGV